MTPELITLCLNTLNDSCPFDECIDYDDETKEFVHLCFIDIADPEGMGGLTTRVHEYKRMPEEEAALTVWKTLRNIHVEEAILASCSYQFEIPQEAWDSECERTLDDIFEAIAEVWRDSEADFQRQEQSDLQWEADHMY